MDLLISEKAAEWYKDELMLNKGDSVRFFVRYGGFSSFQKGFSLGLSIEPAEHIGVKTEASGITFYIREEDLWYLDDHSVSITLNEKLNEPEFNVVN
ncbi:HesB/YadR/YfhF family protein [Fredinandcohnia sp. 179-A 10B2 NHS]|uniref:HesB/YadR/YfhF family protein n=1 Tax=Fredinandcohnia sp. 179-A 10B2 NHS TaxID=3235176 RepID=UPI0039A3436B